ncbi:GbsR/MarR family transcriptional regulator [Stackebrandtia soli]|uniref:GbsR/MarR family transcriptional regulator n=1 Tax=Stackebrandtia soli TaxID=1892856 RepID=UPI0039E99E8E
MVPSRDESAVREFVERFGAMLADHGFPRMPARVLMALTAAEEDSLTAAELSDRLGVSAAAISGALKYLTHVGLAERIAVPNSRRNRYAITDQSWYTASIVKSGFLERFASEVDTAVDAVGGSTSHAGDRLREMRDFYLFLHDRLESMMDEWAEWRKQRPDPPSSSETPG